MTKKKFANIIIILLALTFSMFFGGNVGIKTVLANFPNNNQVANARTDSWDGLYYPEWTVHRKTEVLNSGYIVNEAAKTITIASADGFVYFAYTINVGDESAQDYFDYTINLTVNIDLGGHPWFPIGCSYIGFDDEDLPYTKITEQWKDEIEKPSVYYSPYANINEYMFTGIFNGNNNVIENVNIYTGFVSIDYMSGATYFFGLNGIVLNRGLFSRNNGIINNLTLESGEFSDAPAYYEPNKQWCRDNGIMYNTPYFPISNLGGYDTGTIFKNVTPFLTEENLKNGCLVGFNEGSGSIQNCKVKNFTIYVGAVSIGGITGYNRGTIQNCEVENIEIDLNRNLHKNIFKQFSARYELSYYDNLTLGHLGDFGFGSAGVNYFGGIAGYNERYLTDCKFIGNIDYALNLRNCYHTKDIMIPDIYREQITNIGGIAGASEMTIENCIVNSSTIKLSRVEDTESTNKWNFAVLKELKVGGIVGEGNASNCSFNKSDSVVSITSEKDLQANYVGGISGKGNVSNCSFVGEEVSLRVSNSHIGQISYTGGLAGYGNVTYSYFYGSYIRHTYYSEPKFLGGVNTVDGQRVGGLTGSGNVNGSVLYVYSIDSGNKNTNNPELNRNYCGMVTTEGNVTGSYRKVYNTYLNGSDSSRQITNGIDLVYATGTTTEKFFQGNGFNSSGQSLFTITNYGFYKTQGTLEFYNNYLSSENYVSNRNINFSIPGYEGFPVPKILLQKVEGLFVGQNTINLYEFLDKFGSPKGARPNEVTGNFQGWFSGYDGTTGNGTGACIYFQNSEGEITATSILSLFNVGTSRLIARIDGTGTSVTFNANGGGMTDSPGTYENYTIIGAALAEKNMQLAQNYDNTFPPVARASYEFKGWYDKISPGTNDLPVVNSNGKLNRQNNTYVASSGTWAYAGSSLTLYASWGEKSNNVSIEFMFDEDGDGEYIHYDLINYVRNQRLGVLPHDDYLGQPMPGNPLYRCAGIQWKDGSYTLSVNTIYSWSADSITVYGTLKYEQTISGFYLSYNPGVSGVTGEMQNEWVGLGVNHRLKPNVFVREGYKFTGWEDAVGTSYTNEQIINISTSPPLMDMSQWGGSGYEFPIIALWQKVTNVTFDPNGGLINSSTNPLVVQLETGTRYTGYMYSTASRVGYTLDGWYVEGTEIKLFGNNSRLIPDVEGYSGSSSNWKCTDNTLTVVAKWIAINYSLSFDYVYPTGLMQGVVTTPKTVTYDQLIGALPSPAMEHATFRGWRIDSVNGTAISANDLWKFDGNKTAYADWELDPYYVTAHLNGGSFSAAGWQQGSAQNTMQRKFTVVDHNLTIDFPEPNRTGYTFMGWYENSSFTGNVVTEFTVDKDNLHNYEIYAKWEANDYNVNIMYYDLHDYEWKTYATIPVEFDTNLLAYLNPYVSVLQAANKNAETDGWYLTGGDFLVPVKDYAGVSASGAILPDTLMKTAQHGQNICISWVYSVVYDVNYNANGVEETGTYNAPLTYSTLGPIVLSDYNVVIRYVVLDHFALVKRNGTMLEFPVTIESTVGYCGNLEISAVYTHPTYIINFNVNRNAANGTTGAYITSDINRTTLMYPNNPIYLGGPFDFSDYIPTCSYYKFLGWSAAPDSGVLFGYEPGVGYPLEGAWQYDPNGPDIIDSGLEITLYARWEAKKYAVVFNVDMETLGAIPGALWDADLGKYYQLVSHFAPAGTVVATPSKNYEATFLGWYFDEALNNVFAACENNSITRTTARWLASHDPANDHYYYNVYPKWFRETIEFDIYVDPSLGGVAFTIIDREPSIPDTIISSLPLEGVESILFTGGHYHGTTALDNLFVFTAFDQFEYNGAEYDSFIGYRFKNWTDEFDNGKILSTRKDYSISAGAKISFALRANHEKIEYVISPRIMFNDYETSSAGTIQVSQSVDGSVWNNAPTKEFNAVKGDIIRITYRSAIGYMLTRWYWPFTAADFGTSYTIEFTIDNAWLRNIYDQTGEYSSEQKTQRYSNHDAIVEKINYSFVYSVSNSTGYPFGDANLVYNEQLGLYEYGNVQFMLDVAKNGSLNVGADNIDVVLQHISPEYSVMFWRIITTEGNDFTIKYRPLVNEKFKIKLTQNMITSCVGHHDDRLPLPEEKLLNLQIDLTKNVTVSFVGSGGRPIKGGSVGVDLSGTGVNLLNPYSAYYGELIYIASKPDFGFNQPVISATAWENNRWVVLDGGEFDGSKMYANYDEIRFEVEFPPLEYAVDVYIDIAGVDEPIHLRDWYNSEFVSLLNLSVTTTAPDLEHITHGSVVTLDYSAAATDETYSFIGLLSEGVLLTNKYINKLEQVVTDNLTYTFKFAKRGYFVHANAYLYDPANAQYFCEGDNPGTVYVYKTGEPATSTEIELAIADNYSIEFSVNAGYKYYGYSINGSIYSESSGIGVSPVASGNNFVLNFTNFTLEKAGSYAIMYTKTAYKFSLINDNNKGIATSSSLDRNYYIGQKFSFGIDAFYGFRVAGFTIGELNFNSDDAKNNEIILNPQIIEQAAKINNENIITVNVNYVSLYRIYQLGDIPYGVEIKAMSGGQAVNMTDFFDADSVIQISVKVLDGTEEGGEFDYTKQYIIESISGVSEEERTISWFDNFKVFNLNMTSDRVIDIRVVLKKYTVTIENDDQKGTVTGAGEYEYGKTVVLRAQALEGYRFKSWLRLGSPISVADEYVFTIYSDVALSTQYVQVYALTIDTAGTLINEDAEGGFVSGAGVYDIGSSANVVAQADRARGYYLSHWLLNGETAIELGNQSNFEFVMNADAALTAVFEPINYEFVTTSLQNYFDIDYSIASPYHFGQSVTVGLKLKSGIYADVNTMKLYANNTYISGLSFDETQQKWSVNFEINNFNFNSDNQCVLTAKINVLKRVNISSNYADALSQLTVQYFGEDYDGNNTDLSFLVPVNSYIYFSAQSNSSYSFVEYKEGENSLSTYKTLTLKITDDFDIMVIFEKVSHQIDFAAKVRLSDGHYDDLIYNTEMLEVSAYSDEQKQNPITASPFNDIVYFDVLSVPFGYQFEYFIFNDIQVSEITMPAGRAFIYVVFTKLNYQIEFNAANATVVGAGTYQIGDNVTLKISPDKGYEVTGWQLNAADIDFDESIYYTLYESQYTSFINFTFIPKSTGLFNYTAIVTKKNYTLIAKTSDMQMGLVKILIDTAEVGTTDEFGNVTYNQAVIDAAQPIILSAAVTDIQKYIFLHWERNSAVLSQNPDYELYITDSTLVGSYTAVFKDKESGLNVVITPQEAYKTAVEFRVNGELTETFRVDDVITASIIQSDITKGYTFAGWYHNSLETAPASSELVYTFTMTSELMNSTLLLKFDAVDYNFRITSVTNGEYTLGNNESAGGTVSTVPLSAQMKFNRFVGLTLNILANEGHTLQKIDFKIDQTIVVTILSSQLETLDIYSLTIENFDALLNLIADAENETIDVFVYYTINTYSITVEYVNSSGKTNIQPATFYVDPEGRMINYDGSATVSFDINPGFVFDGWSWQSAIKFERIPGSDLTYSYTIENVRENKIIYAHFSYIKYYITPVPNNVNYGTVTGAGEYCHYDSVTFVATAYKGYYFSRFNVKNKDGAVVQTSNVKNSFSFLFLATMAEYTFEAVFSPYKIGLNLVAGKFVNDVFVVDSNSVYGNAQILGGEMVDGIRKFALKDEVTVNITLNYGYAIEYLFIANQVCYPTKISIEGESVWQYLFNIDIEHITQSVNGMYNFNLVYSIIKYNITFDYNLSGIVKSGGGNPNIATAYIYYNGQYYYVLNGESNNSVTIQAEYLSNIEIRSSNNYASAFKFNGFYLGGQNIGNGNGGMGVMQIMVTKNEVYTAEYLPIINFKNFDDPATKTYYRTYNGEDQQINAETDIECDESFREYLVILYNGYTTLPKNVGSYTVQAYINVPILNNYKTDAGSAAMIVRPRELRLTFSSKLTKTYDGNALLTTGMVSNLLTVENILSQHRNLIFLDFSNALFKITKDGFDYYKVAVNLDMTITGLALKGDAVVSKNYVLKYFIGDTPNESVQQFNSCVTINKKRITLYGLEFANKVYDGTLDAQLLPYANPTIKDFEIISSDLGKVSVDLTKLSFRFENAQIGADKLIVAVDTGALVGIESGNYELFVPTKFASIHPYEIIYDLEGVGEFVVTDINKNVFLPIGGTLKVFSYSQDSERYRDIYKIVRMAVGRYREFTVAYVLKIYVNGIEYRLSKQVQITISTDFGLNENEVFIYDVYDNNYERQEISIENGKIKILTNSLDTYAVMKNKNILTPVQIIIISASVVAFISALIFVFVYWRKKRKTISQKFDTI